MATQFNPLLDTIKVVLEALKAGPINSNNPAIVELNKKYDEYVKCCCHAPHVIVKQTELKQ